MAKRKTFFVTTDVFDKALSPAAIAVYTYLSFCGNKERQCFPSVRTIANACGIGATCTRDSLRELIANGLIRREPNYTISPNGRKRRMANLYTLLGYWPGSHGEVPPPRDTKEAPSPDGGEINNDSKAIMALPSIGHYSEEKELEGLIAGLELDLYEDQRFAKAIEQAIRAMYRAEAIKVNGQTVPRSAVRDVLRMLTIDHIDYILSQLCNQDPEEPVRRGQAYLIACLYNAPADCLVNQKRAFGR